MYRNDRAHFVPRYLALMKNGFDAPPSVLLKRYLDLDLSDPRMISNALTVIQNKIDLLEKAYQN